MNGGELIGVSVLAIVAFFAGLEGVHLLRKAWRERKDAEPPAVMRVTGMGGIFCCIEKCTWGTEGMDRAAKRRFADHIADEHPRFVRDWPEIWRMLRDGKSP